jgi:subtilase family serine protease
VTPLRRRLPAASLVVAVGLAAITLAPLGARAGAAAPRLSRPGTVAHATTDAVVARTITTSFDVALKGRHRSALVALIAAQSDPSSPSYHRYLTPRAFAARFGAPSLEVNAVRRYFTSFGLRVGSLSAGGVMVRVTGSSARIARAFGAPVETVRLSSGTLALHFVRTGTLPATIARDVTAVAGLDVVRPLSTGLVHPRTSGAVPVTACPSAGPSTNTPNNLGGYTVQQQAALYGLAGEWNAGDTGVGSTIGVYELSSYVASDVATYLSCYGVAGHVSLVNVDGGPTSQDNAGGATNEATLDVEEAQVLAPGAQVVVYQGTQAGSGPTDIYSQIASQDVATVVTTSWGICEAQTQGGAQAEQPLFQEMAAQGQTVVSAAGDQGSADCEDATTQAAGLAVDDPASQPYVTGVGGLTVSSVAPLVQSVWNDRCHQTDCGSGGGGLSSLWTQPAWQVAPGITTTGATGGHRMVPDLSVMGDPSTGFIQYFTGGASGCGNGCPVGWSAIGGTSIGSPLIAALVAVGAQGCQAPGGRLGFLNPLLYAMSSTGFTDVTSGSNDLYNLGAYSAGPGFDMASGLGSPNGAAFFAGLCPSVLSNTSSTFVVSSISPSIHGPAPSLTAHLVGNNGTMLADASLQVTATAGAGTLTLDGQAQSSTGPGAAALSVTTDATGKAVVTITSSQPQDVTLAVAYGGQTLYTTTIAFSDAIVVPGAPSFARLLGIPGGITMTLRPPRAVGGATIVAYQYALDGGRWVSIARGARTVTVTGLRTRSAYRVRVRALNAAGPSPVASARVVTK